MSQEVLTASIIRCPYDGSSKHLWNTGKLLPDHMVQQSRRESSSPCLKGKLESQLSQQNENNYPALKKQ
jgi:hypothetical protein